MTRVRPWGGPKLRWRGGSDRNRTFEGKGKRFHVMEVWQNEYRGGKRMSGEGVHRE